MLNLLVAYGRRPWQAGIPCAVLVALGCVLFSPKKMEAQKPEDTPRVYSRFWYSLGLFLPFVDLQADKVWKPKADQTFLRNYIACAHYTGMDSDSHCPRRANGSH